MNAEYSFKAGQALVIIGPTRSASCDLAKKIAAKYGAWREIEAHSFEEPFGLGNAIHEGARTLICEGIPQGSAAPIRIKEILSCSQVVINRKYRPPSVAASPHLVFCISEDELTRGQHVLRQTLDFRNFDFLRLNAEGTPK